MCETTQRSGKSFMRGRAVNSTPFRQAALLRKFDSALGADKERRHRSRLRCVVHMAIGLLMEEAVGFCQDQ